MNGLTGVRCALLLACCSCIGAQGPQGSQGAAGPAGDEGPTGPQGPRGEEGLPGIGLIAYTTADGGRGLADGGLTVVAGPPGPTGPAGAPGTKGGNGANGTLPAAVFTPTAFEREVTLAAGMQFAGKVTKTAPMTGVAFRDQMVAGTNVCPVGFNPCVAWQAMILDALSDANPALFDGFGWVLGSAPETDVELRSFASGEHSVVCPANYLLMKYPSQFTTPTSAVTTPGGLHCRDQNDTFPVWCCRR